MAVTPPLALRKPIDVRESPILAIVILLSRITPHVKVVPEKSVSIDASTNHKNYIDRRLLDRR